MKHLDTHTARRALGVGAFVVMGLALVGFVFGTQGEYEGRGYSYVAPTVDGEAPPVLSYQERMAQPRYLNQPLTAGFGQMVEPAVGNARDALLREQARISRQDGRAFEGAPPTVPHPVDQSGVTACVVCHATGVAIQGTSAPQMSHQAYANCTQCHVERQAKRPFREADPEALPLDSSFEGFHVLGDGDRVWDGAPPQTPHTTFMRENCASCHGTFGPAGLQTTHPERASCLQCHGLSSEFDQRPEGLERHVF